MNRKAFLALSILSIIIVSGCIGEKTEIGKSDRMYVKSAIPVYNTTQSIDSDSKAQQVFNENVNLIVDSTKQILNEEANYSRNFLYLKDILDENNEILLDKTTFERRTYQKDGERFGAFWFGDFNKEQYTFKVYFRDSSYNVGYIMDLNGVVYLAG